jgi:hypothetical protein
MNTLQAATLSTGLDPAGLASRAWLVGRMPNRAGCQSDVQSTVGNIGHKLRLRSRNPTASQGRSMRVTCQSSAEGSVYRLYRSDDQFVAEMQSLVPFLYQADCDISVGGTAEDPDVVLIVGPLSAPIDDAFRERVKRFMKA